jgi:hypothetical protein
MSKHAKDGAPLEEFVTIAVKYSLAAEQELPRAGPGAKPTVPDWVLAVMVAVGILLRKKAKNAQHIWWCSHREEFQRWFPGQHFPGRSTFYDRYRRIWILFQKAIELQGRDAVDKGWANAKVVAVDKSLIAGRGRPWAPRDRRRKHIPKRVDPDTTWSYSKHDSWVQGYSFETVVTAPARGTCWPLAASCDTASRSEQKSCLSKFDRLPHQTTHVLADAGYDSNAVAESVERRDDGRRTGRRFLCPEVPRSNIGKPRQKKSRQSRERQRHRQWREKRRAYLHSTVGRRLYARRKTTVEPFNSHLKLLFDLEDRVWHWGLDNNRSMVLAAIFAYQTLLTFNHRRHKRNRCIKCILDRL